MEQSDIRVPLTTTDLACSIPDFASLNPGYLLGSPKANEARAGACGPHSTIEGVPPL